MCLDVGRGKRLQRAKTHYVTLHLARPVLTKFERYSSQHFDRLQVTFGGIEPKFKTGHKDAALWDATAVSIFI